MNEFNLTKIIGQPEHRLTSQLDQESSLPQERVGKKKKNKDYPNWWFKANGLTFIGSGNLSG